MRVNTILTSNLAAQKHLNTIERVVLEKIRLVLKKCVTLYPPKPYTFKNFGGKIHLAPAEIFLPYICS